MIPIASKRKSRKRSPRSNQEMPMSWPVREECDGQFFEDQMTLSLDPIRDDLIAWAESLYLDDAGAFRNGDAPAPSLLSSLFIAYILFSMDAVDEAACDRAKWIAWIQSQQNAQDGSFAFPPRTKPRRGIAFWNAVRVLNILGAQVARFPRGTARRDDGWRTQAVVQDVESIGRHASRGARACAHVGRASGCRVGRGFLRRTDRTTASIAGNVAE